MIPPESAERFLSAVRVIGYDSAEFVLNERVEGDKLIVFVTRGAIKRRYSPSGWIEDALRELRAGVFGKR